MCLWSAHRRPFDGSEQIVATEPCMPDIGIYTSAGPETADGGHRTLPEQEWPAGYIAVWPVPPQHRPRP